MFLVLATYPIVSCTDDTELDGSSGNNDLDESGAFSAPEPGATTGTENKKITEEVDTKTGKSYQKLCSAIQCDTNGDGVSEETLPLVDDQLSIGITLNARHESSPYETADEDPNAAESGIPEAKHKYVEFIFIADNAREVDFGTTPRNVNQDRAFKDLFITSTDDQLDNNNKVVKIMLDLIDLKYTIDYTVIPVPEKVNELGTTPIASTNIHRIQPSDYSGSDDQKSKLRHITYRPALKCTENNNHWINLAGCIFQTPKIVNTSDIFSGWKAAINQIKQRRTQGSNEQTIINKRKFYVVVLLTGEESIDRMGAVSTFEAGVDTLIAEDINPSKPLTFTDRIKFINLVANGDNNAFGGAQGAEQERTDMLNRLTYFKTKIDEAMGEETVVNFYDHQLPAGGSLTAIERALEPKPKGKEIKDLEINSSIFAFINKAFPTLELQCLLDTINIIATGEDSNRKYTANAKVQDNLEKADFTKDDNDEYKNIYVWHDVLDGAKLLTSVDITTTRCCVDMHSDTERSEYEKNGELQHPLEYFYNENNTYPSIDDPEEENICYTTSTKEITYNIDNKKITFNIDN